LQKIKDKVKNKKVIFWAIVFTIALILSILSLYICQTITLNVEDSRNINSTQNQVTNTKSSQITQFEISIPALDISAPVIPNVDGTNKEDYLSALTKGVAHYEGSGLPGYGGNIFIFGHSSSPETVKGKYDKIFSYINNLNINDEIIVNFNNKVFVYLVSTKKIIKPEDKSVLNQSDTEQVTLMTCWPIGDNTERLVIVAKYKES